MTDEEKFNKWIEEHDADDYCEYCIYSVDCDGGIKAGPNGPIEPPCCTWEIEEILDKDAVLEDLEEQDV